MNKELESWIFAVSANLYLDYRTFIAPDFLCQAKKPSLLARNAGGDLTDQKIVYIDEEIGQLTLVFRVIEALANDFDLEGDGVLKDSFGREIYLIEGVVFKGKFSNIQLNIEDFDNIHNKVKEHFCDFWEWVTPQQAIASSSQNFEVDENVIIEEEKNDPINEIEDQSKKKVGIANHSKNPSIQILLLCVLFLIIIIVVLIKFVL